MRISLGVFGREVLAIEVVGNEEDDDLDTLAYEVGSESTPVDLEAWRELREDADLPPTVLVAGHSHRRRRPPIVRVGKRERNRVGVDVNHCAPMGFDFPSRD